LLLWSSVAERVARHFAFGRYWVRIPAKHDPGGAFFQRFTTPDISIWANRPHIGD
jgi:hypothetical protein